FSVLPRAGTAMNWLRTAIGTNFLLSALVVVAWIGYGLWQRLPFLDEECLGIEGQFGVPAWFDCLAVQFFLLVVFFRASPESSQRRVVLGGVGAWGLF